MVRAASLLLALLLAPAFPGAEAGEPEQVVAALYAGHPYADDPPGGLDVWEPGTRALWVDALARMETGGKVLDFDLLAANGDGYFSGLVIGTEIEVSHEARIRADLDNGEATPATIFYGLVRSDERWRVIEAWREGEPGGWRLTEMLGEIKQDGGSRF